MEVLQHLKEMAARADLQGKRDPIHFRVTIGTEQILPDYQTIDAMRNRFVGNEQGLRELQRLLDQRQADLEQVILSQQKQSE